MTAPDVINDFIVARQIILEALAPSLRAVVEQALRFSSDYIDDERFDDAAAVQKLVEQDSAELPDSNREFLRYNCARRYTVDAVAAFQVYPSIAHARKIALWYRRAREVRDGLVNTHLALVAVVIRQSGLRTMDQDALISEGNLALLRAVDTFEVNRGFTFSTYAGKCIRNALRRVVSRTRRYRTTFPVAWAAEMEHPKERNCSRTDREQDALQWLRRIIRSQPSGLSCREWTILQARFALDRGPQALPMTLQQAGRLVGLAKERVRQIQSGALTKLRGMADAVLCC